MRHNFVLVVEEAARYGRTALLPGPGRGRPGCRPRSRMAGPGGAARFSGLVPRVDARPRRYDPAPHPGRDHECRDDLAGLVLAPLPLFGDPAGRPTGAPAAPGAVHAGVAGSGRRLRHGPCPGSRLRCCAGELLCGHSHDGDAPGHGRTHRCPGGFGEPGGHLRVPVREHRYPHPPVHRRGAAQRRPFRLRRPVPLGLPRRAASSLAANPALGLESGRINITVRASGLPPAERGPAGASSSEAV